MTSRPRSSSKASKLVEKIKSKLSPPKVSKRKRDESEPGSLFNRHPSTSPERPMKRLRSQADPSSESSQLNSSNNRSDRKDKPRPPKKSKRELKIEVLHPSLCPFLKLSFPDATHLSLFHVLSARVEH